ncbi:hypothetical protein SMMN14_04606 [Sphaerulina musiva]
MPPKAPQDARSDNLTIKERQVAAAAHARASKQKGQASQPHGTMRYGDLPRISNGTGPAPQPAAGMQWEQMPRTVLEVYRVAHNLDTPASFTSPRNQALLTNPGIGRHSPTMRRAKHNQRQSEVKLATQVRKHFNAAAVNETEVVAGMQYVAKNKDKAFKQKSTPNATKKS